MRPSHRLLVPVLVLAVVASAGPAVGQEAAPETAAKPTLSAAVAATALAVTIDDQGRLTGPGGDWVRERAAESAAVMVGENHGLAEVPRFVTALWATVRPLGFGHLAIETGPVTAELLESQVVRTDGAYEALVAEHPLGVPFYGWQGEAELLRSVLAGAGDGGVPVLWGVDQEFVLSAPIHLPTLREMASGAAAREVVDDLLGRPLPEDGNPQNHPLALTNLSTDDVARLDAAFGADAPPAARRLVDEILESHEIYRLFVTGDNYGSNARRARLLRRNLLDQYRAAEEATGRAPRFVGKFGLAHVYRGRTSNNAFDVGNLSLAFADEQDRRSLVLGVVCGPESRAGGFGPPQPCSEPFPGLATPADGGWVLYDFEAVRPLLHDGELEVDDPALERMVWNLDGVVVLPRATAAVALGAPEEP